jgi:hypothetical protein
VRLYGHLHTRTIFAVYTTCGWRQTPVTATNSGYPQNPYLKNTRINELRYPGEARSRPAEYGVFCAELKVFFDAKKKRKKQGPVTGRYTAA